MSDPKQSVYMHWAKTQGFASFNLATSGVQHYLLKDLGVETNNLEINGPTYYGYEPLNVLLAAKCAVPRDCVAPAIGTSMANHLVLAALLEPGDEVLIEQPTYEPLLAVARYLRADVRRFPREFSRGFQINLEALRATATSRTKLIVMANLHNPSSVQTDQETLQQIGEIAAAVGANVLVDEVYLECLYPKHGEAISSFHLGPQFIATGSLTKAYGLSGLRCGWILAQPQLIRRFLRINDLFASVPPHTSELLSIIALNALEQIGKRAKKLIDTNRKIINEFFDQQNETLELVRSPIGTTFFPRLKKHDPEKFFKTLREKYDTSVVPGRFFELPQHFRIGIGGSTEILIEGLRRFSSALEESP
jgi:aspartate/methionine/tyrosine aminotransferase